MAAALIVVEIVGDNAMLINRAAKLEGVSIRRFILDAATERAHEALKTPRLVASK